MPVKSDPDHTSDLTSNMPLLLYTLICIASFKRQTNVNDVAYIFRAILSKLLARRKFFLVDPKFSINKQQLMLLLLKICPGP